MYYVVLGFLPFNISIHCMNRRIRRVSSCIGCWDLPQTFRSISDSVSHRVPLFSMFGRQLRKITSWKSVYTMLLWNTATWHRITSKKGKLVLVSNAGGELLTGSISCTLGADLRIFWVSFSDKKWILSYKLMVGSKILGQ